MNDTTEPVGWSDYKAYLRKRFEAERLVLAIEAHVERTAHDVAGIERSSPVDLAPPGLHADVHVHDETVLFGADRYAQYQEIARQGLEAFRLGMQQPIPASIPVETVERLNRVVAGFRESRALMHRRRQSEES